MVAKNLTSYYEKKDQNGVLVGSWAVPDGGGWAKCKSCDQRIKFENAGLSKLLAHSETLKHISNSKATKRQPTLNDIVGKFSKEAQEDIENKEAAKLLEIKLVRMFSRHDMSVSHIGCLVNLLKESLTDSEIIKQVGLTSEYKARYTVLGLSKTYHQKTVQLIKESDAICIGFDESENMKREEMEIIVKMSHPRHGVITRHFKTVELEHADAEYLCNTLLDQFTVEGINLEELLISVMTDGTNVMIGQKSGVIKRIMDNYSGVHLVGSCSDHHLNNSLKAAVTEFDPDMEKAMVNLYEDVAGSKGRSQKSRKEFQKISMKECGVVPVPVSKFVSTRFRSIRHCVDSCLINFSAIVAFYTQLQKPTPRQKNLQKYFVDQAEMTKLKLFFVQFASKDINQAIDFFEEREDHAHEMFEKMEELLSTQIQKFMKTSVVKKIDEEGNIEYVSGADLLKVDLENKSMWRNNKSLKIGEKCEETILKLGLTPDSPQLKWFFDSVKKFHSKVATRYQKYFKIGLESRELRYMSALSTKARKLKSTELRLTFLSKSYQRIVKNIQPISGQDQLDKEIQMYVRDTDLDEYRDMAFKEYWEKVSVEKEGKWAKYEILPRFARALSSQLNSNSECERKFSDQTKIASDSSRNRMSQDMFDGHLQVRSGVESELSRIGCEKCIIIKRKEEIGIEIKSDHCHCVTAPVSTEMIENCQKAWKEYRADVEMRKEVLEEERSEFESIKESKAKKDEEVFEKLRKSIQGRSTFLPPNKMIRVWETEKEMKERKKANEKKVTDAEEVLFKTIGGEKTQAADKPSSSKPKKSVKK